MLKTQCKLSLLGSKRFPTRRNQQQTKVRYLIGARTKLEGKLSIGSQATVEYRSEDGNNMATHMYVLPASGMHSRERD